MASINNLEKFKARIAAGQVCVGTAITFGDPAVSELYGDAGYDFTWIDMEHGPFDLPAALGHIMAARGTDLAPFVRVPANDPVLIKPVLDLVPAAIIVPMIKTPEDAAQAVRACRYPPRGIRGYSPRRGTKFGGIPQAQYLESADEQTLVLIQIEQIEAVQHIDLILQTPGLDGICLGPNDLSGSMGKLGRTTDPEVAAAIDTVMRKARQTDLLLGVATGYDPKTVQAWLEKGIQWICLNTDYSNMYQHSKLVLEGVRQVEKGRLASAPHPPLASAAS
jgi:2-dehydro-3-deoxyglucarate aldolase/4-hydroxy-2-oxoheptanedioate aldolase